ncbi:Protein-lysine N-methyltransferase [Meloidogyne graminicola]|uniref:Protein-lysine N-methyltransferase n=1 Tax=Meloidogyne graminicola TaxID=189291 RepID=A0A8S9ZDD9_9BILA|nr:Protein-lysine N-methyltransferase [Meloidogyne graminicola]
MSSDTLEDISLAPETLAILDEFFIKKNLEDLDSISEDWQLSQFWYTDETSRQIVNECICSLEGETSKRIACISCPSLIKHFIETEVIII